MDRVTPGEFAIGLLVLLPIIVVLGGLEQFIRCVWDILSSPSLLYKAWRYQRAIDSRLRDAIRLGAVPHWWG